ncbi:alpha-isopropylmalate synthase regulatory domain-containing protein, partial [Ferroglobus sp.]|uniref:alpha-isopropylmalate synthase regulatory domain-containing protein n=1 Tax=Ferroglobus sp. TaxID=2614230 RepID=UPI0025BD1CC0
ALEEVVMALEYLYGIKTKINKKAIYPTSKLVEKLTRVVVPPNKPIVGENAFTHESGIHTSAVLKDAKTYEPISPEVIGRTRSIILGKHAGKASVEAIMKELGYKATKEQMQEILKRVKEIGDKGKRVTDADVKAIIETVLQIKRERKVELLDLNVVSGANIMPTASVKLKINGKEYVEAGVGVGPVDAAINAIKRAVKEYADIELVSYHVDAITGGTDALVDVIVQLKRGDKIVTSRGARTDIIMASVEAFVEGLNMLL